MHVLVPEQVRGAAAPGTAFVGAPAPTDAAVSTAAASSEAASVDAVSSDAVSSGATDLGARDASAGPSPRVGFVVSKAVGNSVVRHRVARKLRHVLRERLDQVPPGSRLVVRALPKSATANSARLAADIDRALRTLLSADSR
jgi:ribonuclease P protein component